MTRRRNISPAAQLRFRDLPHAVPCFTPGTLIATASGERPVETLRAGDRIATRDNGFQTLRWVGGRSLGGDALERARHLRPILLRAGALGEGLPERDMMVSPNHRLLVAANRSLLRYGEPEVLVSAKHLVGNPGIAEARAPWVTYIHLLFSRHQLVLANGAWTESFQPRDWSLGALGNAQRLEILELFPDLATGAGLAAYASARPALTRAEATVVRFPPV